MTLMDNELKEEMKAQAKAISQKLRADGRLNSQMTLAEIERTVLLAGQQFQAALTEAVIEATEIEGERYGHIAQRVAARCVIKGTERGKS